MYLYSILYRIPLRMYALIAFLTVSTMGLSNTSLGYLNYPTQVIFKSCKLIPVMLGGMIIQGEADRRLRDSPITCSSQVVCRMYILA